MASLLRDYTTLSSSSSRNEVWEVLRSIIDAPPSAIDQETRGELIQELLRDLKTCTNQGDGNCRLIPQDASRALFALKTLGKQRSGSEMIASPANFSILLAISKAFEQDSEASSEALRCVANALLLIESARAIWVSEEVGGGATCIELLETLAAPDQIFLASRILFLCTVSESSSSNFLCSLVEGEHNGRTIMDIIEERLDGLTDHVLAHTEMSSEAMTDLLKFVFNLLLRYPKLVSFEIQNSDMNISEDSDGRKIMGDFWNPILDGFLSPLLRVYRRLPLSSPAPLGPPLTHVIHCLITIPISPRVHPIWFPHAEISDADRNQSVLSPSNDLDFFARSCHILDISLNYYFPGNIDPNDTLVTGLGKNAANSTIDDTLGPLALLITRFCLADNACKRRLKDCLLPTDLDRTHSLEARGDLLGRCLRLLTSLYHPKLKDSIGEMLYSVCDCDAAMLCSQVGYGNVAGFLFHKGITNSPVSPSATLTTSSGLPINPITGTIDDRQPALQITDEEKAIETEKLFVLFDRLEKSGALPAEHNPIRKALQGG